LSRQTPFSMWPGGVKPFSSHRTSIESNVGGLVTRQLTVATVQGACPPSPPSLETRDGGVHFPPTRLLSRHEDGMTHCNASNNPSLSKCGTETIRPTMAPASTQYPSLTRNARRRVVFSSETTVVPASQQHPLPRMKRETEGSFLFFSFDPPFPPSLKTQDLCLVLRHILVNVLYI